MIEFKLTIHIAQVWRCYVIYRNCRKLTLCVVLLMPCVLLSTSVGEHLSSI